MPPPPRGHSRRGSLFHVIVLAAGFIIGGLFTQVGRRPLSIDLVILKFALGPVVLDVSLLSLLGVLLAYLIARSLF